MISVVFYGRNDSHGYNLHKRVALGLNCTAEILDGAGDEILFVDYNSDDALPTLPEALQDTLTPRAKRLLRIIRVRPGFHRRFAAHTALPVLEPIARNIAIRRADPANRWVLSANPDMILIPRGGSLTAVLGGLADGLYHIPRFELPEAIWEGFDRLDPAAAAAAARHWGRAAHLDEIVRCDVVRFDAVGDFQLVPRADLHRIHGFHEGMLRGWHQDSNLAKRLGLFYGKIGDLSESVVGYHCDHTRQATTTHGPDHARNSWHEAFDGVDRADLPEQAESWGWPGEAFEELRLTADRAAGFPRALSQVLGAPAAAPYLATRNPGSFGAVAADPRHVLPYVGNVIFTLPRSWSASWFGGDPALLRLFRELWSALGFTGAILVPDTLAPRPGGELGAPVRIVAPEAALAEGDLLLFDFPSAPSAPAGTALAELFRTALTAERRRAAAAAPLRNFVCINAVHTAFEQMVAAGIRAVTTPFSTRVRHGVARVDRARQWDWTQRIETGEAGMRRAGAIVARPGRAGTVAYGPHGFLPAGRYRATLRIAVGGLPLGPTLPLWLWQLGQAVHLKIVARGAVCARRTLFGVRRRTAVVVLDFAIGGGDALAGAGDVELWIWTYGTVPLEVSSVVVERADAGPDSAQ